MSFALRTGSADDADLLIALFDASIGWQVRRGLSAQWGSTPFSQRPDRVASCRAWAAAGGMWVAERDGRAAAAMVLGPSEVPQVPAAREPEVYVRVLVGAHQDFARGAGRFLLDHAEQVARDTGVTLLRVDCFAGNDGALVRYYQRCGFRPTETFAVGDWRGQVLERRLS